MKDAPPEKWTGQRLCAAPREASCSIPGGRAASLPAHCPPSTYSTLLHCPGCCKTQSSGWLHICLAWLWVICLHQLFDLACAQQQARAGALNRADKSRCAWTMWPVASCFCTTLARLGITSMDGWGHTALTYLTKKVLKEEGPRAGQKTVQSLKIHPQSEILGRPDLHAT